MQRYGISTALVCYYILEFYDDIMLSSSRMHTFVCQLHNVYQLLAPIIQLCLGHGLPAIRVCTHEILASMRVRVRLCITHKMRKVGSSEVTTVICNSNQGVFTLHH